MNTTDKIMALADEYMRRPLIDSRDGSTTRNAIRAEIEALVRDAERYRFIRDASRSECIEYELRTYSMETLDEYVDAAIEDEAAMQEKQS